MLWHSVWHGSNANWFLPDSLTSSANVKSALYWSKRLHPGKVGQPLPREGGTVQEEGLVQTLCSVLLLCISVWVPTTISFPLGGLHLYRNDDLLDKYLHYTLIIKCNFSLLDFSLEGFYSSKYGNSSKEMYAAWLTSQSGSFSQLIIPREVGEHLPLSFFWISLTVKTTKKAVMLSSTTEAVIIVCKEPQQGK